MRLAPLQLGSPPEVLAGNMEGLVLLLSCVMHRDREPTLRWGAVQVQSSCEPELGKRPVSTLEP
jgi:hypothetical protein